MRLVRTALSIPVQSTPGVRVDEEGPLYLYKDGVLHPRAKIDKKGPTIYLHKDVVSHPRSEVGEDVPP